MSNEPEKIYFFEDNDLGIGRGTEHVLDKRGSLSDIEYIRADIVEAREQELREALERLQTWAQAYPLEVFPEPDFKKVREALKSHGISLDAVSASNMRHVISGVSKIVDEALQGDRI